MKIIIAGAGAVGSYLAMLLSRENHDIVLVDGDPDRIAAASEGLDIMTLTVSPTNLSALREAGTSQADLFIAVTPEETRNMTCCFLAHKLGAKKTIARIDNSEYLRPADRNIFADLGIDSLIYPEALAASEIINGVKRSWVRQSWEIHNGALVVLGIKLRQGAAALFDKPIRELCPADAPYHIVVIKRGDITIIPGGNDELQAEDIVYFMTKKKYISTLRRLVGKDKYPDVRRMMMMGGGDITVEACRILPDNIDATILETNRTRCHQLAELLDESNITIVQADGRDTKVLQSEGITHQQAFCALTHDTENNILACLAAKQMGVLKTVALIENSDYIPLAEKLDIGTIINTKNIASSYIYQQMLKADVTSVKNLTIADADVAEFTAEANSLVTKRPIKDVGLPVGITIGGIVREGEGILCNGSTQILPADSVVVFYKPSLFSKLDHYFR